MSPELLTEKQVAAILGLSAYAVRRWRMKDTGPPWVKIGSRVRYPARELARWIHSRPRGGEQAASRAQAQVGAA